MEPFTSRLLRRLAVIMIGLAMPLAAAPAPYIPDNDDVVLERLPIKSTDPAARELRSLRIALAREPGDSTLAVQLAQAYIERGRAESDPRYLGYAQAALSPWWDLPQPPVDVLVLRAIIHQANHQFDAALAELDHALQRDPNNAQAWLTRASIQQARGDYGAARKSCFALAPHTGELVGYACLTAVSSLSGSVAQSYALLQRVTPQDASLDAGMRMWIHGLLAEMAARRGDAPAAETHFERALSAAPSDSYLLASYADFLLDQGRNEEVVALLRERTRADPLLLRLAIAERRLEPTGARQHIADLRSRFEASRLRGDVVHRREEAMFHLNLLDDAHTALRLAVDNWAVQREPADVRILLASALAANAAASARPALAWLAETRLEDVHVQRLVHDLARMTP